MVGEGEFEYIYGEIDAPNLFSLTDPNRSIIVADCRRVPRNEASNSLSREY